MSTKHENKKEETINDTKVSNEKIDTPKQINDQDTFKQINDDQDMKAGQTSHIDQQTITSKQIINEQQTTSEQAVNDQQTSEDDDDVPDYSNWKPPKPSKSTEPLKDASEEINIDDDIPDYTNWSYQKPPNIKDVGDFSFSGPLQTAKIKLDEEKQKSQNVEFG